MAHKYLLYKPKKAIIISKSSQEDLERLQVPFKSLNMGGKDVIAVKDDLPNYYKLKEVLPDLECPIHRHYEWPKLKGRYDAMSHQKVTAGFIAANPRNFVGNGTGSGKTFSILLAYDYLRKSDEIDCMVIVCPISVIGVWENEIFGSFMNYQYSTLFGTSTKRKDLLGRGADIFITNFDGVKTLEKDFIKWNNPRVMWVVDEASKMTNSKTALYDSFNTVVKWDNRLTLASATPTPKNPSQGWALARLINKETPKFFGRFRDMVMYKVTEFKWNNKPDCNETVRKYLQPGIIFRKEDCLDLPPVVTQYVHIPLTDEQEKVFKRVKKDMVAELKSGVEITAVNAAHTIGVLRQTCLGVVKTGEDEYEPLDCQPRIQAIIDICESDDSNILICIPYTGAIRYYFEALSKHFPCAMVDGSVPRNKRKGIFDTFNDTKDIKCLLIHDAVGSHGWNAQDNCSHLIMAGPIFSADNDTQLSGRISRKGQKNKMTITRLYGTDIEQKIYESVETQNLSQAELLALYRKVAEE